MQTMENSEKEKKELKETTWHKIQRRTLQRNDIRSEILEIVG